MSSTAKAELRELVSRELNSASPYLSFQAIRALVRQCGLAIGDASLKVYLSQAVRQGVLHDAGRGWYSCLRERVPLDTKVVGRLIRLMEKTFPLLEFSCWSTAQINPWMHHVLAQPMAFLFARSDALEIVGETLQSAGWDVAVNPLSSTGVRIRPGERSVVLRPALSKQPPAKGHRAPVEKMLVDLLVEAPKLALMDDAEARAVARTVSARYRIQVSVFMEYSKRRGVKVEGILPINQVQFSPRNGIG